MDSWGLLGFILLLKRRKALEVSLFLTISSSLLCLQSPTRVECYSIGRGRLERPRTALTGGALLRNGNRIG